MSISHLKCNFGHFIWCFCPYMIYYTYNLHVTVLYMHWLPLIAEQGTCASSKCCFTASMTFMSVRSQSSTVQHRRFTLTALIVHVHYTIHKWILEMGLSCFGHILDWNNSCKIEHVALSMLLVKCNNNNVVISNVW